MKIIKAISLIICLFFIGESNCFSHQYKIYAEKEVYFKHERIDPVASDDTTKKMMIEHYVRARKELEESVADVIISHPDLLKFLNEYLNRFHHIIRVHALVDYLSLLNQGKIGPSPLYKIYYTNLRENYYLANFLGVLEGGSDRSMLGTGYVGANPLSIRKVLTEGNIREKMFQFFRGGRYLEFILKNPPLVEQINHELQKQQLHWKIRIDLLPPSTTNGEVSPFSMGAYANFKARKEKSLDVGLKERERCLKQRISDSKKNLRIPLSKREKRFMRTLTQEKDPYIVWLPGKFIFHPSSIDDCPNCPMAKEYVKAVYENYLEQFSSVSSTTDRMLTSALYLDFTKIEELYQARLVTLTMIDSLDHNMHEVLFASKSFNLPFSFTADFYKEIFPLDPLFLSRLIQRQKERGFEMPDYYLSEKFNAEIERNLSGVK